VAAADSVIQAGTDDEKVETEIGGGVGVDGGEEVAIGGEEV
jgi:hypothetical protein